MHLQSSDSINEENGDIEKNVSMPENIQLLSSRELHELITEHRNDLALYVTRFHPQKETEKDIIDLQRQLAGLQSEFKNLEEQSAKTQEELEECRVLESQYVKQYQDLNKKIRENYSDVELKLKLESQIKHLDNESNSLELEAKYDASIDKFVGAYMAIRTKYHIQREKLSSWNAQGELRI